MLLSADKPLVKPFQQITVLDLLDQHSSILMDCGEAKLARRVKEIVVGLRHLIIKEWTAYNNGMQQTGRYRRWSRRYAVSAL